MSRVNGALKDFKANSGDDINDGGIPEKEETLAHQTHGLKFRPAST